MKIKLLAFGKLADLLPQQEWELADLETAGMLRIRLEMEFPALKSMRYRLAVDKKIATDDTPLAPHSVVALLPLFRADKATVSAYVPLPLKTKCK